MLRTSCYLAIFWAMQVVAQLLFKWGSLTQTRWLAGFILGNLFGFSSIWLLMLLYKMMPVNVALGLATAGSFLLGQVALAIVFHATLLPLQWIGIGTIVFGVILLASGDGLWTS
ncbi:MAG TPA: hypothetical protein HPP80_06955 [Rhodospirillaceae bacterium]|nr:hypothetical protein [Rhodospirillaceae bacterium]